MTVEELHSQKLKEFSNDKQNLQEYKKELEELKKLPTSYITENKITSLKEKIQKIQTGDNEIEYYLDFIPIIQEMNKDDDSQTSHINTKHSVKQGNIDNYVDYSVDLKKEQVYGSYIRKFRPDLNLNIPSEYMNKNNEICSNCGAEEFVKDPREGCIICTECGYTEQFMENDSSALSYKQEEIQQVTQFSYKRINHFQECLSQFQAKESTDIPGIIIDALLEELRKHQIQDPALITPTLIKGYLKKLKYNKYYEHIPFIINQLCGLPPPRIDSCLEDQLKIMFEEIQTPFEKYRPKGRKNFLSYNFILHKMCQLLGKDHLLICFPLLKSREKLYQQDSIWKKICNDLRWQFIASI